MEYLLNRYLKQTNKSYITYITYILQNDTTNHISFKFLSHK